MIDLRCRYERYATNADGEIEITLSVDKSFTAQARKVIAGFNVLANQNKNDLRVRIDRYKEKRSLSANAYLWVLCDKLGAKLRTTKEVIYKRFIRDCGVFAGLKMDSAAVKSFQDIWASRGLGWFADIVYDNGEVTDIHAYYGSSVYDKEQMQRLLDSVVDECQSFGIETKTPDELADMMSLWNNEKAH